MTASGVMAHVTIYLASKVASALERIILKALEAYLASPKRSCFDDVLAVLANSTALECATCKNKACWDPYPMIENIKKESNSDNITIE
jgi:hypothetical protein